MSPFINQTTSGLIIMTDFWFPISLLANWLDLKKEQEDIFSSTQKTYILQIDRETAPGREWNTLEKRILSGKLPDETCRLPRVCSIRWIFDKETTESVPQKYSPTSCRRTTIGGKTPHGFRCLELAENMTTVAEDWCGKALVFFYKLVHVEKTNGPRDTNRVIFLRFVFSLCLSTTGIMEDLRLPYSFKVFGGEGGVIFRFLRWSIVDSGSNSLVW